MACPLRLGRLSKGTASFLVWLVAIGSRVFSITDVTVMEPPPY